MDVFKKMERGDFSGFQGTDLRAELALSQQFLNRRMSESAAGPVEQLAVELQENNIIFFELAARVPVAGSIRRRLKLQMAGELAFGQGKHMLVFHILSGFKMLDKPVIKFFKGKIADSLPAGIEFTKDALKLNVKEMMEASGSSHLLAVLRRVELVTEAGKLIAKVHIQA